MGPDEMVRAFEDYTGKLVDDLFPLKTCRIRSNEAPWVTGGIRRLANFKRAVYKREGKSELWCRLQARMDARLEESKSAYVDQASESGQSTRSYFDAVKRLSCKERPPDWSLMDLFPGSDPKDAGDKTAAFFTQISDQFTPLQGSPPTDACRPPVTLEQVRLMLKRAKKPSSSVKGDILPRLVKQHHALMRHAHLQLGLPDKQVALNLEERDHSGDPQGRLP